MNDRLIELINEIQDCRCELEELNECGDLEDRVECALKLADLEQEHFKLKIMSFGFFLAFLVRYNDASIIEWGISSGNDIEARALLMISAAVALFCVAWEYQMKSLAL